MTLDEARNSYSRFVLAMNSQFEPTYFQHNIIAPIIDGIIAGDPRLKRVLINLPFRHSKTTLGTINMVPFFLGHHPEQNVIALSYGKKLARSFGRKIRDIMQSPVYLELFPQARIAKSSRAADEFATISGGNFWAAGFDSALNGIGANLLIIDDPYKHRSEATSEVIQQQRYETYNNVVRTRCEPNATIIMNTTRWTPADLVGWRISEDGATDFFTGEPYEDERKAA